VAVYRGDDAEYAWLGYEAAGCFEGDLHFALYEFDGCEEEGCYCAGYHAAVEHAGVGEVAFWVAGQFCVDSGGF